MHILRIILPMPLNHLLRMILAHSHLNLNMRLEILIYFK